jgi:hypothetical protein
MEYTIKILTAKIMQSLWKLSEIVEDEREAKLLELAGNLVEGTFSTNPLTETINTALQDVFGESCLHEDLQDSIGEGEPTGKVVE